MKRDTKDNKVRSFTGESGHLWDWAGRPLTGVKKGGPGSGSWEGPGQPRFDYVPKIKPHPEAIRYINRIKHPAKKEYAERYHRWILGGRTGARPDYDENKLPYMGAQAVRIDLDSLYREQEPKEEAKKADIGIKPDAMGKNPLRGFNFDPSAGGSASADAGQEYTNQNVPTARHGREDDRGTIKSAESRKSLVDDITRGEIIKLLNEILDLLDDLGINDVRKGEWREELHPRDERGRFTDKGTGKIGSGEVKDEDYRAYQEVMSRLDPELRRTIETIRAKVAESPDTKDLYFKDGQYTPERAALHDEIIRKFDNPNAVAEGQPELILMGGIPGSGKSSMLRGRDVSKYVVIDSDEIKKSFPEYQGWNAQDFQTEADDVIQKLVAKVVAERKNLIIDGTLKSLEKYSKLIDAFKGAGYRVGVLFADLPIDKAIERALARFQRSGRFVDPAYIATHDRHNFNTFNALKPKLDFYEHYDTNVSRGEKPRLVERK